MMYDFQQIAETFEKIGWTLSEADIHIDGSLSHECSLFEDASFFVPGRIVQTFELTFKCSGDDAKKLEEFTALAISHSAFPKGWKADQMSKPEVIHEPRSFSVRPLIHTIVRVEGECFV